MMIRSVLLALPLLLLGAGPLAGQIALEARAGGAIGNHYPANAGLEIHPRIAVAALAEYQLLPSLDVYAGYTGAAFACKEGFCADNTTTFTSHGLSAGVLVTPVSRAWARAGLIRNGVAVAESSSTAGIGFEIGLGATIELSGPVDLRPGVQYRRHGGTTGGTDGDTAVLVLSIGGIYEVGDFR